MRPWVLSQRVPEKRQLTAQQLLEKKDGFQGEVRKGMKSKQENNTTVLWLWSNCPLSTLYRSCPLLPEVYGETEKNLKGIMSDKYCVAVSVPGKVKQSGLLSEKRGPTCGERGTLKVHECCRKGTTRDWVLTLSSCTGIRGPWHVFTCR